MTDDGEGAAAGDGFFEHHRNIRRVALVGPSFVSGINARSVTNWRPLRQGHQMPALTPLRAVAFIVLLALALTAFRASEKLPAVEANDNRTPAGTLAGGTLTVSLVVQMARWYPESPDG